MPTFYQNAPLIPKITRWLVENGKRDPYFLLKAQILLPSHRSATYLKKELMKYSTLIPKITVITDLMKKVLCEEESYSVSDLIPILFQLIRQKNPNFSLYQVLALSGRLLDLLREFSDYQIDWTDLNFQQYQHQFQLSHYFEANLQFLSFLQPLGSWLQECLGNPFKRWERFLEDLRKQKVPIVYAGTLDKTQFSKRLLEDLASYEDHYIFLQDSPSFDEWTDSIEFFNCQNLTQEAQTVLRIAQSSSSVEPVVIVTAHQALGHLIASQAGIYSIPIHDSFGVPLFQTPLGKLVILWLRFLQNPNRVNGLAFLKSQSWRFSQNQTEPESEDWIDSTEVSWRQAQTLETFQSWKDCCVKEWSFLSEWFKKSHWTVSDLAQQLEDFLVQITPNSDWLRFSPDLDVQIQLQRIQRIWKNFPDCTLSEASLIIESEWIRAPSILTNPKIPDASIHLLGMIEGRFSCAKTVILAGMNDDSWPGVKPECPWLPSVIRKDLGLLDLKDQLALKKQDFSYHLAAKQVWITRALFEKGKQTLPSRFGLEVMLYRPQKLPQFVQKPTSQSQVSLSPQRTHLTRGVLVDSSLLPRRLSPTAIRLLIQNPYGFYGRFVLGLNPLLPIKKQPSRSDQGLLIHSILEQLFRHSSPSESILQTLIASTLKPLNGHPTHYQLWAKKFDRMGRWALEHLASDVPHWIETSGSWILEIQAIPILLEGRVDRLDLYPMETHVIDYKTSVLPPIQSIEQGWEPQLGILGLIIQNGGFGPLNTNVRFSLVHLDSRLKPYTSFMQDYSINLDRIQEALVQKLQIFYGVEKSFFSIFECPSDSYKHLKRIP
jgi:RecB family exonuclease